MQHVPEDPHTVQAELAALHDALTGHNAYASVRRRATLGFASFLDAMVREGKRSPTQFRKEWQQLTQDLGVVGHLLAQLRRDGKHCAYRELLASLTDPTYLMAGQHIAPDHTTPLTLVMLDPRRTLTLLRWLLTTTDHEYDVGAALYHAHPTALGHPKEELYGWHCEGKVRPCTPAMARLLTAYPGLLSVDATFRESALAQTYPSTFLAERTTTWQNPLAATLAAEGIELPPPAGGLPLALDASQYNESASFTMSDSGPHWKSSPWHRWPAHALFLVRGTQADVLQAYPRTLQRRLATWQIHAPTASLEVDSNDNCGFDFMGPTIGLHPQAEHETWIGGRPAFASRGTAHGYGAILASRYLSRGNYLVFSKDLSRKSRTALPLRFLLEPLENSILR